jgi:secreted Zn-dependent insulinase-like peptidase
LDIDRHSLPPSLPPSLLQVSYQLGPQSVSLSAHLDLLVLLLKDEAFNELRTKQQLGYIGKKGGREGGK